MEKRRSTTSHNMESTYSHVPRRTFMFIYKNKYCVETCYIVIRNNEEENLGEDSFWCLPTGLQMIVDCFLARK